MLFKSKNIITILKQFRFQSIFVEYWKKITPIIIIPIFCLNFFIYIGYNFILTQQKSNNILNSFDVAYDTFSRTIDNMSNSYSLLIQNPTIKDYLCSSIPPEQNIDGPSIINSMRSCISQNPDIYSIYLYDFSNKYVISTEGSNYINKFNHRNWFDYYTETNISNFVISGDITIWPQANQHIIQKTLSFCYGVYYQNICHGLIVFNYSFDTFDFNKISSEHNDFFLLNDSGKILYSTSEELIGEKLADHYTYELPNDNIVSIAHNKVITASKTLHSSNFALVSVSDDSINGNTFLNIQTFIMLSLFISFLLPALIALYISFSFYRAITEIINSFSYIESFETSNEAANEINYITQQITELSSKKQHFERELSEKIALLKKSQISVMQLQFNQHFLFNTLNHISTLARVNAGGRNPISNAISLLANLLRASLDTRHYLIPIAAELTHAKNYIAIEQLKISFDVNWDIDEDIYEYKIIKLILQPIIENAIQYGLAPLDESETQRLLTIRGYMTKENIIFHIIDSGNGFSDESLKQYQKLLKSDLPNDSNHIGLANVNARIKLIFGNDYGVQIFSDNLSGTDIQITLPKIKNIDNF